MDDAGLHDRLGKDGSDRLRPPLQAIDHSQQDVLDAAVLQLVHHPQPEFGALVLLDPHLSTTFVPSAMTLSAIWIALLRTTPSSRIFTRMASKNTSG